MSYTMNNAQYIDIIRQEPDIVYQEISKLLNELVEKNEQIKDLSETCIRLNNEIEEKEGRIIDLENEIEKKSTDCKFWKYKFEKVDKEYGILFEEWQVKNIEDIEKSEKDSAYVKKLENSERVANAYVKEVERKYEDIETLMYTRENELNALRSQIKFLTDALENNQKENFALEEKYVPSSNLQNISQEKKPLYYANSQVIDIVSKAMEKIELQISQLKSMGEGYNMRTQ